MSLHFLQRHLNRRQLREDNGSAMSRVERELESIGAQAMVNGPKQDGDGFLASVILDPELPWPGQGGGRSEAESHQPALYHLRFDASGKLQRAEGPSPLLWEVEQPNAPSRPDLPSSAQLAEQLPQPVGGGSGDNDPLAIAEQKIRQSMGARIVSGYDGEPDFSDRAIPHLEGFRMTAELTFGSTTFQLDFDITVDTRSAEVVNVELA